MSLKNKEEEEEGKEEEEDKVVKKKKADRVDRGWERKCTVVVDQALMISRFLICWVRGCVT